MADPTLYNSTCIHGFLILCALIYGYTNKLLPNHIILIVSLVVLSSLINHKSSHDWIKWGDRILATVAILALGIHIIDKEAWILLVPLFAIVGFYGLAKYWKGRGDSFYLHAHCLAHLCASVLIIGMLFI